MLFKRGKGDLEDERGILAFAGKGMGGPPVRTLGWIHRGDGGLKVFHYRPWLFLPNKTFAFDSKDAWLVDGVTFSSVGPSEDGKGQSLCSLPPRYRGLAEELAAHLSLQGVGQSRLLGGFRGFMIWAKGLLGMDGTPDAA